MLEHARAVGARDRGGGIRRARVDDHDLLDRRSSRLQAAREHLLLVADDHAEAHRHPLGGPRPAGDLKRPP